MSSALIVFAKRPEPGAVKTRLTETLTPEEAARLYEAFLRDALSQYQALDVDARLYLSPPAGPIPEDLVPEGVSLHQQQGPGLGARMKIAFVESFGDGYQRLVIIGTDHPTLPTAFIEQAFDALRRPLSICIGPSDDGGYYLLGMNDFYPEVFHDMRYSHADVFEQTLERADRTSAHLTILPPWYDVDTPETLRRLVIDLKDPVLEVPYTRRVVAALLAVYPSLVD
ncbi:MAG: TIGR04282 family arsenosugar biosynthesis glycosyltransferase [Rhodothermales bacterium]